MSTPRITLLCAALALSPGLAAASELLVTRFDDPVPNACSPRDCSLRSAVLAANASVKPVRILLPSGTYQLSRKPLASQPNDDTRGALQLRADMSLIGIGKTPSHLRWSAIAVGHAQPLIRVDTLGRKVSLEHLRISHGRNAWHGGCVQAGGGFGSLSLTRMILEQCQSEMSGGALFYYDGALQLDDVVMQGNSASHGGAMALLRVQVSSSKTAVRGNQAIGTGGALAVGGNIWDSRNWVEWQALADTEFSNNAAGSHGGAISLGMHNLRLSSSGKFRIVDNQAGNDGGAVSSLGNTMLASGAVDITGLIFQGNRANLGGALHVRRDLHVENSWFSGNQALAGGGGAIHLADPGSALSVSNGTRLIAQTSFQGNLSLNGGAAVHNAGPDVHIENASFSSGQRYQQLPGATAVYSIGSADLRHISVFEQSPLLLSPAMNRALVKDYSTQFPTAQMRLSNSLVAELCHAPHGGIISLGGNQYGPRGWPCPQLPGLDQSVSGDNALGVQIGSFGGAFPVVGWPSDGAHRPQRGLGRSEHCLPVDVRGMPRAAGPCDSGAFEQQ
ncbi:MAG: hypothetical protein MEQ07_08590 [Aquimonas sp.]|nr:hypothetical protein [Aquimonas sp.]